MSIYPVKAFERTEMTKNVKILIIILMLGTLASLILSGCGVSEADKFQASDIPSGPDKYVQDYAHVLSDQDKAQLVDISAKLEEQSGIQIVFITDELSDPEEIKDIAKKLGNEWGIKGYVLALGVPGFGSTNKSDPVFYIADSPSAPTKVSGWTYTISKNKVAPLLDEKKLGAALGAGGTALSDLVRSDANLPGSSGDPNPTGEQPKWLEVHWKLAVTALASVIGALFLAVGIGCFLEYWNSDEQRYHRFRKREQKQGM